LLSSHSSPRAAVERLGNLGKGETARPASAISGPSYWSDAAPSEFGAMDADGNLMQVCAQGRWSIGDNCIQIDASGSDYQVQLPSSKYSMIEVTATLGNLTLRALVPSIGEESKLTNVALDERSITEAMIVEARLSADKQKLKTVTPDAYLGTRTLIYQAFDQPGPTQDLLDMVKRIIARYDPTLSQSTPDFFGIPVYEKTGCDQDGNNCTGPGW
jgi:hypothetical protein